MLLLLPLLMLLSPPAAAPKDASLLSVRDDVAVVDFGLVSGDKDGDELPDVEDEDLSGDVCVWVVVVVVVVVDRGGDVDADDLACSSCFFFFSFCRCFFSLFFSRFFFSRSWSSSN